MSEAFALPFLKITPAYSPRSNDRIDQLKKTSNRWSKDVVQGCQVIPSALGDCLTHTRGALSEIPQITKLSVGRLTGKVSTSDTVGQHVKLQAIHLLRALVHLAQAGVCLVLSPVLIVKPRFVVPLHQLLKLDRSWGLPSHGLVGYVQKLLSSGQEAAKRASETIKSNPKVVVLPVMAALVVYAAHLYFRTGDQPSQPLLELGGDRNLPPPPKPFFPPPKDFQDSTEALNLSKHIQPLSEGHSPLMPSTLSERPLLQNFLDNLRMPSEFLKWVGGHLNSPKQVPVDPISTLLPLPNTSPLTNATPLWSEFDNQSSTHETDTNSERIDIPLPLPESKEVPLSTITDADTRVMDIAALVAVTLSIAAIFGFRCMKGGTKKKGPDAAARVSTPRKGRGPKSVATRKS